MLPSQVIVSAVVPKKKLEAEPGARRMRRTITYTRPDGQVVVKEITYTQEKDQDKVLHALLAPAQLTPMHTYAFHDTYMCISVDIMYTYI